MIAHSPRPLLSVVVPCYNEQDVLTATHERLVRALATLDMRLEIIYVNDGSTDCTEEILRALQAVDERVRVLLFARNFGHQTAVTAGIDHARGDAVVLIDADLQDPPEVVPQMIGQWLAGYEVVYGQRTERAGETPFKLWTARMFYRLLNRLSDTEIPLDVGDFRLMDRKVVDVLKQMPERDRFIRGMVSWVGFRQIALPYRRDQRFAGQSKYPLQKMLRFALDGILSFSLKPLRLATFLGLAAIGLAGLLVAWIAFSFIFRPSASLGLLAVLAGVGFLGGVQLFCTGILGEYIGRIYRENQERPLYILREELGGEAEDGDESLDYRAAEAA
jgi:dolichol-phosphate mannosyltransferase